MSVTTSMQRKSSVLVLVSGVELVDVGVLLVLVGVDDVDVGVLLVEVGVELLVEVGVLEVDVGVLDELLLLLLDWLLDDVLLGLDELLLVSST